MKVRMKVSITGLRDGKPWPPAGGEIVVSDQEGADLCTDGMAELVEASKPEPRTATAAKPETRAKKKA